MNKQWAHEAVFYHIYPLGFCGAPHTNDFCSLPVSRLRSVSADWIDHFRSMGVTAVYFGPLFESTAHGYDTADYYHVDRRLGTNDDLTELIEALHASKIRVILDGVFNHVGRHFWALDKIRKNPHGSPFRNWFSGFDPSQQSPFGDPFTYKPWEGHYDLVTLNLNNPEVRKHLFEAVDMWINKFDIDGLRLDVAYSLEQSFLRELSARCCAQKEDFLLIGEMIHGDYNRLMKHGLLDSVTNYECYKGLYSSHNDRNLFEIAYALNRQFGANGLYQNRPLYNFVDNHDVSRISSTLLVSAHCYTLYCLLFTMPGMPSIYYGSEWGIQGKKQNGSDWTLRPTVDMKSLQNSAPAPDLVKTISRLSEIRRKHPALLYGDYTQLHIAHEQLIFRRQTIGQTIIVIINSAQHDISLSISCDNGMYTDLLNTGDTFDCRNNNLIINNTNSCWARVLLKG